jgi:hypothetical protein
MPKSTPSDVPQRHRHNQNGIVHDTELTNGIATVKETRQIAPKVPALAAAAAPGVAAINAFVVLHRRWTCCRCEGDKHCAS